MQDIVNAIVSLSTKPEDLKKLNKWLGENVKVIKKHQGNIEPALEMLQLPGHTLGILYLLHVKVSVEIKDQAPIMEQIRRVLIVGDLDQIQLAPNLFSGLARKFTEAVMLTEKYMRGILPLQTAIAKLQGTNANLLTSVHANFVQCCLKAKCYSTALYTLDTPVFEIKKENGIEPVDYLQYFYYGGMIYCGLKKFTKALEFFQMALTCPSKVLSAIQVEAYKKYVCCCLITTGEVTPLPGKLTSQVVARNVIRLAGHYEAFARAYKLGVDVLVKSLSEHTEAFKKDRNYGLIKQSIEAHIRRNITRLTATYVTLSLADITRECNLKSVKDCEKILLGMIEDGTLYAQINQKDGMVIFQEQPDEYNSATMIKQLDSKIQEVVVLSEKLKAKEKEVVLNMKYIVKTTPGLTANLAHPGGGGPANAAAMGAMGAMGPGFGGFAGPGGFRDDEDIQLQMAMDNSRMHS